MSAPAVDVNAAVRTRVKRTQAAMAAADLSAAVLMKPRNMFYLTAYNTVIYSRPQYLVVVPEGDPILVLPRVRYNRAKQSAHGCEIQTYSEFEQKETRRDPQVLLAHLLRERVSTTARIGMEMNFVPIGTFNSLSARLPDCDFADVGRIFEQLRLVKDEVELVNMRKACEMAEAGMQAADEAIQAGATEIEINNAAEDAMRRFWGQTYPADEITGFGDDEDGVPSALYCWARAGAHAGVSLPASTNELIPDGEAVLIVIWSTCNGYAGEYERTIFKRHLPESRRRAYEVMLGAREATRKAIRPGLDCEELVNLASNVMNEGGFTFGPGFIGHGLGLGHHEAPHIVPGNHTLLQPGAVIALEPGMLFPEYAVRHSDTILVTETGCESLTSWDKHTSVTPAQ